MNQLRSFSSQAQPASGNSDELITTLTKARIDQCPIAGTPSPGHLASLAISYLLLVAFTKSNAATMRLTPVPFLLLPVWSDLME
jgi:hypothetical protein